MAASLDGIKGMDGVVAYASTKRALRGITKAAAMEPARDRILVNVVRPEAHNPEMSAPILAAGIGCPLRWTPFFGPPRGMVRVGVCSVIDWDLGPLLLGFYPQRSQGAITLRV